MLIKTEIFAKLPESITLHGQRFGGTQSEPVPVPVMSANALTTGEAPLVSKMGAFADISVF